MMLELTKFSLTHILYYGSTLIDKEKTTLVFYGSIQYISSTKIFEKPLVL